MYISGILEFFKYSSLAIDISTKCLSKESEYTPQFFVEEIRETVLKRGFSSVYIMCREGDVFAFDLSEMLFQLSTMENIEEIIVVSNSKKEKYPPYIKNYVDRIIIKSTGEVLTGGEDF